MRILVVTPSVTRTGGGVSEVARLASLGLSEREHHVQVATLADDFFEQDVWRWKQLPVRAHQRVGPKNFGFSPGLLLGLFNSRADLVHVHGVWMFHCAAVLAWSLITGGRYVVTPHGMLEKWIRRRSPLLKWIVSLLFHDCFLRRASCFQVLTEKEIEDVREVVESAPVRLIPNYVEVELTSSAPTRPAWWRPEFDQRDVYLYFGRIHEKKGCLELCHAWHQACAKSTEFRQRSVLVFCGWVDHLPSFEPLVAELQMELGNIHFAGPQYGSAKASTLSAATFFILPSKSEGLPMAILEAWAHAKPVLMTKECNLSAAFADRAAIQIEQDASSLSESLMSASLLTVQERVELSRNGQNFLRKHYSKASVIDQLTALYTEVVSAPGDARVDAGLDGHEIR
ncbi:hypothetical protein CVM73_08730 [Bradyrhizobium forestalis]|uniref:Glycosyltransferase subfamily 4-like N-terminal domain-containing protein n=1 Tax=Bradyrhizobium forestalis TaxID=1419263 RepID=A0A2M8RCU1_9BRAD|nr:glycosyltransferase [Bradyrhizobium forestalis]PJG55631.1 hypothetical protein CVM73_08730 [Bradyrhizobium forestalis]